jgi:hypothetical protein
MSRVVPLSPRILRQDGTAWGNSPDLAVAGFEFLLTGQPNRQNPFSWV